MDFYNTLFKPTASGAYTQHLGSGFHHAARPAFEYSSASRTGAAADAIANFARSQAPSVPIQTNSVQMASAVEPGPRLDTEERAAAL